LQLISQEQKEASQLSINEIGEVNIAKQSPILRQQQIKQLQ
jgi:sulfate adenylyltransferase subunit 1 (EFTu-like GTPase family)